MEEKRYESKRGRPYFKYNREIHDKIVSCIKRNAPYEVACMNVQINENTLTDWMKKGRQDIEDGISSDFAQLVRDILDAESEKIMSHLDHIEAGGKAWRPRLDILERRWPQFFGRDSAMAKEFMELILKLQQDMLALKENQGKGFLNGGEMDSKSD